MEKNKRFLKTVCLAALAILTAATFVCGLFVFSVPLDKIWEAFALTALSFVAWYFAHNALHEIFHAIFTAAFGGRVISVAFWGLEFNLYKKFGISPAIESGVSGWTEFICKEPDRADRTLLWSLWGGIVGTALTVALVLTAFLVQPTFIATYLFLMGLFPVIYMFAINFLFPENDGDGALLRSYFKDKAAFYSAAARLETEGRLFKGEDLSSAMSVAMRKKYADEPIVTDYDYLLALTSGDISRVKSVLTDLSKSKKNFDNGVIDELFEKAFVTCAENGDLSGVDKEYLSATFSSDRPDDIRVHHAYRLATGDTKWAQLLEASYFKAIKNPVLPSLEKAYEKIGVIWLLRKKTGSAE